MKQLAGSGPLLRGLHQAPRHKVDELWGPAVAVPEGGRRLGGDHEYGPTRKRHLFNSTEAFQAVWRSRTWRSRNKLPPGGVAVITNYGSGFLTILLKT
jgi:hypothetical protein